MTVQPPSFDPQATPPPPPVADRRAPDRRSGEFRRAEDRTQLARTAVVAATSICGGLAVVFFFFALLGTIDFADAVGSVIIAIVLALVWLAGFIYRHRHEDRTVRLQERERRGF